MKHLECSCSLSLFPLSLFPSPHTLTLRTRTHTHTQVLKRITMTQSATISLATSTALLEKSSGASADRRHYGRVCGKRRSYTKQDEMYWRGGSIYSRGQNTSQRRNTLMSFPSLVLCTFSNQPAFFRSYAIHKRFHLVHIQAIVVCVCVCVCVHLCVCAVILVYARKLQKVCHTHMHAQVLTSLITGNCDKVCTAA